MVERPVTVQVPAILVAPEGPREDVANALAIIVALESLGEPPSWADVWAIRKRLESAIRKMGAK